MIIVLLRTVSKMLERIIAVRLLVAAHSRGLIRPKECSSLPGLSPYDACFPLVKDVTTWQMPRLKASASFGHQGRL